MLLPHGQMMVTHFVSGIMNESNQSKREERLATTVVLHKASVTIPEYQQWTISLHHKSM
jgi:hypothetical protein